MRKYKVLLITSLVSVVAFSSAIAITEYNHSKDIQVLSDENTTWKHYAPVAATENTHGSKEFWANCSLSGLGTHVLEKPTSGHIIEKSLEDDSGFAFDETDYFDALDVFDDRYIYPLTLQGKNNVSNSEWETAFNAKSLLCDLNVTINSTFSTNLSNSTASLTYIFDSGKSDFRDLVNKGYSVPSYTKHVLKDSEIDVTGWIRNEESWNIINSPLSKDEEGLKQYLSMFLILRDFEKSSFVQDNNVYRSMSKFQIYYSGSTFDVIGCSISFDDESRIKFIDYKLKNNDETITRRDIYTNYGTTAEVELPPTE